MSSFQASHNKTNHTTHLSNCPQKDLLLLLLLFWLVATTVGALPLKPPPLSWCAYVSTCR